MIQSLSLSARVTFGLHNLNSEGFEGNQQQTRIVHVIDASGRRHAVNAVSGDMFKHIYVQHLTAVLKAQGHPLSASAAVGSADRITVDADFKAAIKGHGAAEVQNQMLSRCTVTDIAGTLFTEGITVARKSCVEFGWVVGIPERVETGQHFHVKYEVERRKGQRQHRGARGRSPDLKRYSIGPRIRETTRSSATWNCPASVSTMFRESSRSIAKPPRSAGVLPSRRYWPRS